MHTIQVLHKLLYQSVPSMHATRLNTFLLVVQALTQGARATPTSLGRGLVGLIYDKHKIKRTIFYGRWLCLASTSILNTEGLKKIPQLYKSESQSSAQWGPLYT